jgi:hypothetical protein
VKILATSSLGLPELELQTLVLKLELMELLEFVQLMQVDGLDLGNCLILVSLKLLLLQLLQGADLALNALLGFCESDLLRCVTE